MIILLVLTVNSLLGQKAVSDNSIDELKELIESIQRIEADSLAFIEVTRVLAKVEKEIGFETVSKLYSYAIDIFESRERLQFVSILLKDLLEIAKRNEIDSSVFNISFRLAHVERKLLNLESAAEYAISILGSGSQQGNQSEKANLLYLVADVYYYKGLYNRSLEYCKKSDSLFRQQEDSIGLFKTVNHFGLLEHIQGNSEEALKYFNMASSIANGVGYKQGVASSFGNVAMSLFELGDNVDYLSYMNKCMKLLRELNNKEGLATGYNNIGYYYYSVNDYPKAITNLKKSIEISLKIGFKTRLAQSYHNMAYVYYALGDHKKAYEYKNKAADLDAELNQINSKRLLTDMSHRFEILQMDLELDNLRKENDLKNAEIDKSNFQKRIQTVVIIFFAIVFFMGFLVTFFMYKLNIQKNRINKELKEAKHAIERQASELRVVNNELNQKNQKLSDSLNALKSAQNQMIQSEKMASLGTLMSGIAHEMNNPFNFISGGIQGLERHLISRNIDMDKKTSSFFTAINEGVNRAGDILKSMNDFSRNAKSSTENCDINDIIENCLLILNNQIKDHIRVNRKFTNEPYQLIGNIGDLHQVMINIILNAIDAMEDGGEMSIETEVADKNLVIHIKDSGHGIEESVLMQITDPFFTTKSPGKGIGLGLSTSYNIIRAHEGNLEINSTKDTGTHVIVQLPIQ